jgi:ribosomal protein L3
VRRTAQNLLVVQVREADNVLLIRGAIPGSNGDYVVIREAKKRPKGWVPHAERPENIKKAQGKKK